jgi:hypothetical protein
MKVSIITVCCNSAATIADALHSVDTQTCGNIGVSPLSWTYLETFEKQDSIWILEFVKNF